VPEATGVRFSAANYVIENNEAADAAATFDPAAFWTQFRHGTAVVGGVRLHCVEGGSGPPVLLLPGWPQSWYAWRLVMPVLAAARRRVVALDPRGMGDSGRPAFGYGIPSAETNLKTWHFAFNRLDDLPEALIQGREREFLTWLFASKSTRAWRIGQAGLDEYVRVLAAPGALRAALAYYRAAFRPDVLVQSQARAGRKPDGEPGARRCSARARHPVCGLSAWLCSLLL